jgi:hypothetical protein
VGSLPAQVTDVRIKREPDDDYAAQCLRTRMGHRARERSAVTGSMPRRLGRTSTREPGPALFSKDVAAEGRQTRLPRVPQVL